MSKRQIALDTIRSEYAKYGKETTQSMRVYVENRISGAARDVAIRAGLKIYNSTEGSE